MSNPIKIVINDEFIMTYQKRRLILQPVLPETDNKNINLKRIIMKLTCLFSLLFLCFTWVSCVKEEAPNAEADIVECIVSGDILKRDPIVGNDRITLMVKTDTDLTKQSPEFVLTPGATISPVSGTELDFSTPKKYLVTSEDGHWSKTYTVTYIVAGISTRYDFEHVEQTGKFQTFYEENVIEGGKLFDWASGNSGFALTGDLSGQFPTSSSDAGKSGKCLKLQTMSTGAFGGAMHMPIAAGNLFMGTFDVGNALTNALKATQFGLPFEHVPTYLTGFYKFKAGKVFEDKGVPVPNKTDKCDIYAIFYETDDKVKTLDGTNAFTHPNLISVARIDDQKETEEWTQFYIPFVTKPGKSVDKSKLEAGKYNVAIVFSSSLEGDRFNGAVGSTLYIDEVELIYAQE